MPYRERLNNVNEAKRITESFGYSDIFATLSLSLSGSNSQLYITKYRGRPRDDLWIFLQACKEVRLFFAHTFVTIHCR